MITFLEGELIEKTRARLVLNVNGVGYEVFISMNSFDRLPGEGRSVRILTYHHIREDIQIQWVNHHKYVLNILHTFALLQ